MADGNLNFDTKIDQSGFVKGIKSIGKGVTDFAADIKNLVNRAISSFKQITAAYQTQIEAEARLGATMRNSTSATKEQIQSVKDLASALQETGIVGDEVQLAGAQELATYVGSVDSIKKMLPVLNDMIAQQYGFNATTDSAVTIATMLGKVLQGQTSALSRYGYKFTEAQEQLLKFGTEEQKVATLAEVVEESVSGVNKALADTPTGKVKQLSNDFGDLKETLGKFLTEIAYPIVVQLDVIVKKLNEVFTEASKGIKELFGIADDVSIGGMSDSTAELDDTSADTADNFADIAESAKEAEKANKGSLAAFDELNVLSFDNGSGETANDNTQIAQTANTAQIAIDDLNKSVNKTNFGGFIEKIRGIIDAYKPIIDSVKNYSTEVTKTAKQTVQKYLDEYGGTVSSYSDKIRTNLTNTTTQTTNGISNIINEAASSQNRMSGQLSSGYADLLGGASVFSFSFANVFTDMFDISSRNFEQWTIDNSGLLGDFFDGINLNIANFSTTFGGILEDMGTSVDTWWEESGAQAFDNVSKAFLDVQTVALDLWTKYISPFIDYITESCGTLWDEHLSPLWDQILNFSSSLMDALSAIWNGLLRPVYDTFVTRIMPSVMSVLKSLWDLIMDAVGTVMDILSGLFKSLGGLLDFITGIFTGDMEKALNGLKDFVMGLLEAIWGAIKGVLNIIIDALNTVWSALYGVIKAIVDGIGDFVGLIGDMFGQNWYFSMPEEPPRIPRLANGTVIPANYGEFAAILGDNKRDPEIVSPIPAMKQAFLEALAESGLIGGSSGDIVIEIDGREVFRAVKKENDTQKRRHGGVSLLA